MKKIDLYIIKKYLSTFFFTVLIITMIAIVIDISQQMERFIENEITVRQIFFEYYLNYIPFINGLLFPLYAMIAVIFFTSRMAYNSEIISIFNAGVSFYRMLFPYMVAASIIAGIHLIGNHYIIPKGNQTLVEFKNKYIKKNNDEGKTTNIHFYIEPETKIYIKYYKKADTTARDFRLEKFEDGSLVYLLKSREASWEGEPNKWKLKNYELRKFNNEHESFVLGKGKTIDTTLNLHPKDFIRFVNERERMSTAELQEFVNVERLRGLSHTKLFELEIHRRTADAFTIIILTLIGVAVAARKVRGGMGLHLITGVTMGALFIVMAKFSITFSTNHSLPPLWGVWIPNIIFFFVALYLIAKAQK